MTNSSGYKPIPGFSDTIGIRHKFYRVTVTGNRTSVKFRGFFTNEWAPAKTKDITMGAGMIISTVTRNEVPCGGCGTPLTGTFTVRSDGDTRRSTCTPIT